MALQATRRLKPEDPRNRAAWDHVGYVQICVVYLAWAGAGQSALERFVSSYVEHAAGAQHRLAVAWKGYRDRNALEHARQIMSAVEHEEFAVTNRELDLTAYRQVAGFISDNAVCFLNSSSTILADGWLAALTRNFARVGIGLVGATGSYESPLSGAALPRRLLRTGRYPPFPNPHVRTNTFMLDPALMLELRWPPVTTKRAAWELESGNRSMTRQIEARGLGALVVGRDGEGYTRERWAESRTFRCDEQQNLLVSDNRTRQYAEAGPRLRRKLANLAWGDSARSPAPRSIEGGTG
jgi:hypothetical protein